MQPEGMVHALQMIHGLLKSGGCLVDIHPTAKPPAIKVRSGDRIKRAGLLQETDDFIEYIQADEALTRAVDGGLFSVEEQGSFAFILHAQFVTELREFLQEEWQDAVLAPEVAKRAEKLLKTSDSELLLIEEIRISRFGRSQVAD